MSHQTSLCPSFLVASLLVLQGHPQHHLRMPRCLHRVPGRLVPPATVALSAALHPHLALQVRKMAFLLSHFSAFWEEKKKKKGPRKCCPCYYSSAAIGRSTLCSPVRGRQHFWRFCWGALYAMPGSVLRKMYLFHLMPNAITLYWHWGVLMTISITTLQRNVLFSSNRVTAEVLDPSSESWCDFFCSQIHC